MMLCPNCHSSDVLVARDMKAMRQCGNCYKMWLPSEEDSGMIMCPSGCGCELGTDDPDARECACDGPCTADPEMPAGENWPMIRRQGDGYDVNGQGDPLVQEPKK